MSYFRTAVINFILYCTLHDNKYYIINSLQFFLAGSLCIVDHSCISDRRNDWMSKKNQDKWLKANYISRIYIKGNHSISHLVYGLGWITMSYIPSIQR